ncbi:Myxococcales GC_trans_RRR domain-containing protein [Stigmatella aurantiaca]|uniref:Myxococcales GC_trans_RRR domain-containing protein n=1 Tax=Stigmatella aurantiaca TaxID=41 RepID=A0A1H7Y5L1_STIAU|nr:sialidase family protein [Stigmatella aurantiaca]SEM41420.1 Myxococcales GC_trans_RRR domain-containing protein [Stigmatella aurantiaca]
MKTRLLLPWVGLLALPALSAWAHLGLPETSNVTLRREHPEHMLVGASFGAVISLDSGQSWRWICPEGMEIGAWRPERYFWLKGGDILAATGGALVRSRDNGCTWATDPSFKETWVTGLAVHPTDERELFVSTGRPTTGNSLYRSEDGGASWTPLLPPSPDIRYSAIHQASAQPRRLYASGQQGQEMFLSRSDDGGQSWTRLPQPFPQLVRPYNLILMRVNEASPDRLWVQVSAQGLTHIFESQDGGATLTPLMELPDVLVGVEASADGDTVWAATPVYLYRARQGEPTALLHRPEGNACATRVGDTLYACGSSWVHTWALARSQDEGNTWEPLFGLSTLQGAHQCAEGTPVQRTCPQRWPQLAELFGAPVPPPPEPPPTDAGLPEPLPETPSKKGCGAAAGPALVPLVLLTLAALRPRRRRTSWSP